MCLLQKYGSINCRICLSCLGPHTIVNINKVEAIQRAAARFCFNNFSRQSSVTAMLTALNLSTLQSGRTRAKLILMYEIINDLRS